MAFMSMRLIWIDWYYLIIQLLQWVMQSRNLHTVYYMRDVHLYRFYVFFSEEIDIHFGLYTLWMHVNSQPMNCFFWSSILVTKWFSNHDSFAIYKWIRYNCMWWNRIDESIFYKCVRNCEPEVLFELCFDEEYQLRILEFLFIL